MAKTFARQEFSDLSSSKPVKTLAPQFGVCDTDVGEARIRGNIPALPREYRNKLQAAFKVKKTTEPARSSQGGAFKSFWRRLRIGFRA